MCGGCLIQTKIRTLTRSAEHIRLRGCKKSRYVMISNPLSQTKKCAPQSRENSACEAHLTVCWLMGASFRQLPVPLFMGHDFGAVILWPLFWNLILAYLIVTSAAPLSLVRK